MDKAAENVRKEAGRILREAAERLLPGLDGRSAPSVNTPENNTPDLLDPLAFE